MSTLPTVDAGTLGWVKSEIEDTALQARNALKQYEQDTREQSAIRMCATHLHQVYGTLTMVELDAAARLVLEAEGLAQRVADGSVSWSADCGNVMRRSIDDLSSYLEGLQTQPVPSPLRLVNSINRLLELQGSAEISEFELFSPDLSARPPEANLRSKIATDVFLKLSDDLRVRFERALLLWLRDSEDRDALIEFKKVFTNMISIERRGSLRQLWWITSALCEALLDGTVASIDEARLVLARVNEQLKLLQENTQAAKRRAPPDDLIKRILLVLAYSSSHNVRVVEIKQAFGLDEWIDMSQGDALPDVEGLSKALVGFANEADAELEQSQNLLARYFSPQGQSEETLDRLRGRFEALQIAAERNGLDIVARLMQALQEVVGALAGNQISDLDKTSLQMAGVLLFVQDSAAGQMRPGVDWQRQAEASVQMLTELAGGKVTTEFESAPSAQTPLPGGGRDVTRAAAIEVRGELQYVEHSLEQIAAQNASVTTLAGIDGHMKRVEGTLEILEQLDGAQLAEQLRRKLGELAREDISPTPAVLDAVAMAVGTLVAGADAIESNGDMSALATTVQRAVAELEALDMPAIAQRDVSLRLVGDQSESDATEDEFATLEFEDEAFAPGTTARPDSLDVSSSPANLELVINQADSPNDMALELDDDLEPELSLDSGSGAVHQEVTPPPVPQQDYSADDEIVGIFFEEAVEVEQELREKKALWRQNPDNLDALRDIRRCFHTLKGSGRFAEAESIAELSWAVEELLNGVLDGSVADSSGIHDFVDRAHLTLVPLIQTRDRRSVVELAPWRDEAAALARGVVFAAAESIDEIPLPDVSHQADQFDRQLDEQLDRLNLDSSFTPGELRLEAAGEDMQSTVEQEPAHNLTDPVQAQQIPDEPLLPVGLSDEVVDVFRVEMEAHIGTISESVRIARDRFPDWKITEELLRTSHTLKGVTRSVGLTHVARMADSLDDLLNYRQELGGHLEEVDLVLVDQSGRLMHLAIARLDDDVKLPNDVNIQFDELSGALGERLRFLRREALTHVVAPAVGETPPSAITAPVFDEDDELLSAFREEAQEILGRMEKDIHNWLRGGDIATALSGLRRELHTLKGGARAVGWSALGDLGHNTETLLEDEQKVEQASSAVVSLVQEVHDLSLVVASSSQQLMLDDLIALDQKVLDFDPESVQPEVEESRIERINPESFTPVIAPPPADAQDDVASAVVRADMEARSVRVSTSVLDELVNYSGEVSILRSRLQQQISMVRSNLAEFGDTVRLFKEQLRDLEIEAEAQMLATNERLREAGEQMDFDPLEMDRFTRLQTVARSLGESLNNLVSVQAGISEFAGDAENTLQQQAHISDSLQDGLLRTRMTAFASVIPRLRHLTRQTARQLNREVQINVSGGHVEVDRKVLDQMFTSFEHMIRNAISHGIEDSNTREVLGKPAEGSININMEQDGNDILIEFSDDGKGIDVSAIQDRARRRGLISSATEMSNEDLMRVLSAPGLSTATEVTQVSGRGVGMDVVSEMLRQLGGSIAVSTEKGKGTKFSLRVPVTLAISHALLVYAGEQMFALPARLIYNVLRIPVEDIEAGDSDADSYIQYNDQRTPVLNLAHRFGLPSHGSKTKVANIIVVRAGLREIAIQVDSVSDTREVVVKPLGELLNTIPGIGAVTMLGDGSIVLILDIPSLWQNRQLSVQTETHAIAESSDDSTTVMVVDDSMTVRNVMGRDLQNNGYEVILAKDGVDAIEQLRHTVPDILLVDLEMPRMDGFELTGRVRADEALKHLPILIITSRSGTRHRDQAIGIGASGYMSKPYRLDDLVNSIDELTGTAGHQGSTLH